MRDRKLRPLLAAAGLALATAAPVGSAAAATLVVDRSNPACTDKGTGAAFCTIGGAAAKTNPGDTVQVRAGIYNEKVAVKRSGAAGAVVTFAADPGVTVTGQTAGFDLASVQWVTVQGFGVGSPTGSGLPTTTSYGLRALLSSNFTLANNQVVNSGGYGIYVGNSSAFTLSGNTVSGSKNNGVYLTSDTGFTLSGGEVSTSGQPVSGSTRQGIYGTGSGTGLITGVTVDRNTNSGIFLTGGTNAVTVKGNTAFGNARGYTRAAPGIEVRGTSGNRIEANVSYNNEDSGIQFYTGASGNVAVDNVLFNNGDHGIDDLDLPQQTFVGNSVFHNVTAGINVEANSSGGSAGAVIESNVSVDNGLNSPRTRGNIRVDPNSNGNVVMNYNLVSLSTSGTMYTWGTTQYPSLAALRAAVPAVEANGVQADPLWASVPPASYGLPVGPGPTATDFQPLAGSPAIDLADSGAGGGAASACDAKGLNRVDDPATTDTGAGPRSFDDRGALEFQGTPGAPCQAAAAGTAAARLTSRARSGARR